MAQKKLQLSEIKVKSVVTLMDKAEQRTSKGGYISRQKKYSVVIDLGGVTNWTEYKTRIASDSESSLKLPGGRDNEDTSLF